MARMRRGCLVVLAVLLGGCTTSDADDPSEPGTSITRTEELAKELGTSRSTVQLAVDAFDVTVAPMPGASPTRKPAGEGLGVSYVLSLVKSFRPELSAEQRHAVDEFVGAVQSHVIYDKHGTAIGPPADGPGPGRSAALAPDRNWQQYRDLLPEVQQDWRQHHPLRSPAKIVLEKSMIDPKRGDLMAAVTNDDAEICTIFVYPKMWRPAQSKELIKSLFAHELFHCHQAQIAGPHFTDHLPQWLYDGSADWARADLYRSAFSPPGIFHEWFTEPNRDLSVRSYDAWVLFELMPVQDKYQAIDRMLATPTKDVPTLLKASGADEVTLLQNWALRSVRASDIPADRFWRLPWPGNPSDGTHDNFRRILGKLGPDSISASAGHTHVSYLVMFPQAAGFVTVRAENGTIFTYSKKGTITLDAGKTVALCIDGATCRCPDGFESPSEPADSREVLLAYEVNSKAVAHLTAEAWDPQKQCKQTAGSSGRCPSATAVSAAVGTPVTLDVAETGAFGLPDTDQFCGYGGDLYLDIRLGPDPKTTPFEKARPVTIPGTSRAWLATDTSAGSTAPGQGQAQLWAVHSGQYVGINLTLPGDTKHAEAAAMAIAKAALSIR